MRILVVEDEAKVASFLRQALEEEGYQVEVAAEGEEGLRRGLAADYDLVILDWLLPGRNGLEVCRGLRQAQRPGPILMLTARDSVDDRIAGLDNGADDYLTKPFALGELLARVRALLRRSAAAQSGATAPLTAGDLTLDPTTRRVERAGREIPLSAKEYALLEYLLRHAGQTVTRTMITEHVWGFAFDSGTNVVDVYISFLRNKIDRGRATHLIQTVRGAGYRLEAAPAASAALDSYHRTGRHD